MYVFATYIYTRRLPPSHFTFPTWPVCGDGALVIAMADVWRTFADFPNCETGPLKDKFVCEFTAAPITRLDTLVGWLTVDLEMVQRLKC